MSQQYRQPPTYGEPLLTGKVTNAPWYRYFQANELGAPPSAEIAVSPTGSPFTYTAPRKGFLIVTGGTVSSVTFSRSGTFYATGTAVGIFPMAQGDQLKITYSAAPSLTWVPT